MMSLLKCKWLIPFFLIGFLGCNSESKNPENDDALKTGEVLLAKTPPMGWNSWNSFGESVNEQAIMGVADVMVETGLKDAGYTYIVIDDYWQGGRDSVTGLLYPDPEKFPSGIKALADYVHSKGLKFGIYSDAGTQTCGEMPGSYGFEVEDANLFAEWGVDYLKYDYCFCPDYASVNSNYRDAIDRYSAMGDALKSTGRPIVFSICEWGPRSPWIWGREVGGNLWRISYDVYDMWDSPQNEMSPIGILSSFDAAANLFRFAGPGGWNDLDMLVVGLNNTGNVKGGGCTETEYRSQMSLWCMLASPLMIGCDIRKMDDDTKAILSNSDIIQINQDPLGIPALRVIKDTPVEAWKKQLDGDRVAIALLNRDSKIRTISANWDRLEMEPGQSYEVYDVWEHKIAPNTGDGLSQDLKPHECKVFIISR